MAERLSDPRFLSFLESYQANGSNLQVFQAVSHPDIGYKLGVSER